MMTRLISDYLSRLTALPQSIVSLRIKQPVLIESGDRIPYTVDIKGTSNMKLMTQLKQANPRIRIENLNDNSMSTIYNVCYNRGVYISKAFFQVQLLSQTLPGPDLPYPVNQLLFLVPERVSKIIPARIVPCSKFHRCKSFNGKI